VTPLRLYPLHPGELALAVAKRLRQVFLHHVTRYPELSGNFFEGVSIPPVQKQGGLCLRRKLLDYASERLNPLLTICRLRRIVVGDGVQLTEDVADVHHDGRGGLAQRVLAEKVARYGEKVRLGIADQLVSIHSQETQVHLLRKVRRVARVTQARGQKPSQPLAVLGRHARDEGFLIVFLPLQARPHAITGRIRAVGSEKWLLKIFHP